MTRKKGTYYDLHRETALAKAKARYYKKKELKQLKPSSSTKPQQPPPLFPTSNTVVSFTEG